MYNSISPVDDEQKFNSLNLNNRNIYGSNKPIYNLKRPPMILNGLLVLLLSCNIVGVFQTLLMVVTLSFDKIIPLLVFVVLELILAYFIFRKNIGTSFSEKFVLCRSNVWLRILRNTIGEIMYNCSLFIIGIIVVYYNISEEVYSYEQQQEYIITQWITFGIIALLTITREVFYTSNCNINDTSNPDLLRFCKITGLQASDFSHQNYTHKYIFYNAYFYKYLYNENSMLVDVNNIVRDPISEYKYIKYINLL